MEGLTKAADLFAIAEVGNSQARTHTVYKTTTPIWNKAFHLSVSPLTPSSLVYTHVLYSDLKDIHSALEVAVYSDKTKPELIGEIKIPLLRVRSLPPPSIVFTLSLSLQQLENGVNKGYVLKSKRCVEASLGVLYLKCELAYQPFRAALRTLKPRESKLMEREAPFQRKVSDIPKSFDSVIRPFKFRS